MTDVLHTTAGDMQLEQVELAAGDRTWSILHTGALISTAQELEFLQGETTVNRPYGIVLWPAAIALAHTIAALPLAGKRVLELGAGTGLPGIIAASLGAQVVQTDRQSLALHVCKLNGERNGVTAVHRQDDWTAWTDTTQYDLIIGSDIFYAEPLHGDLEKILETNLAPGGSVVVADPFRPAGVKMLERLEAAGWRLTMDKWTVGDPPRPVGVFALVRPAR